MTPTATPPTPPRTAPPASSLRPLPRLIFASRWLQVPLYLGLIVAQVVYVILFLKELWHLVLHSLSCPRIFWTPICPTGGIHDEVEHEPNRNQRCE